MAKGVKGGSLVDIGQQALSGRPHRRWPECDIGGAQSHAPVWGGQRWKSETDLTRRTIISIKSL